MVDLEAFSKVFWNMAKTENGRAFLSYIKNRKRHAAITDLHVLKTYLRNDTGLIISQSEFRELFGMLESVGIGKLAKMGVRQKFIWNYWLFISHDFRWVRFGTVQNLSKNRNLFRKLNFEQSRPAALLLEEVE